MKVCTIPDCNNKHSAKGYCIQHYQRWYRYGDAMKETKQKHPTGICEIQDCTNKHVAQGFCRKHYTRWKNNGDPNVVHDRIGLQFCQIPDCNEEHVAQGFCNKHYKRWKKYNDPLYPVKFQYFCKIPLCNKKHMAKGYCYQHYRGLREYGNPNLTFYSLEHLTSLETYVYRLYDVDGNLLYIGITRNIQQRFYAHSKDKMWWSDVCKAYIRKYSNRFEASRIEKQAIIKYNPLYNSRHNKKAA